MSKISKLYIPLIQDFNISSIDMFRDKFLQRMSRENFHDALRAYGIVPHQHKLKWVLEGLSTMKSITKQPTQEKRSTSYLETIDLCNRRIKWRLKEKRGHQLRIDAGQDTESMDEKRREAIRLLDIKIKEQERLRSRAELGL